MRELLPVRLLVRDESHASSNHDVILCLFVRCRTERKQCVLYTRGMSKAAFFRGAFTACFLAAASACGFAADSDARGRNTALATATATPRIVLPAITTRTSGEVAITPALRQPNGIEFDCLPPLLRRAARGETETFVR